MADYKNRARPKKRQKSTGGCNKGLWFFGGFIIGGFAMGLVWLELGPELVAGRVPGASPPKPQASAQKKHPAPKPEFQFYTILPEIEVIIPDEEIMPPREEKPKAAPKTTPKPTQQSEPKAAYILQMGSFRKFVDADRMKARLAFIGIEADIQKVTINNKDTYHRVRSGPYRSQAELQRIRKMARKQNISTLVIKLKG